MIEWKGEKYIPLTKKYHPVEGEILYRFDPDGLREFDPIQCEVTRWGANNHGEKDLYLIEVKMTYPEDFKKSYIAEQTTRKERKAAIKELEPRKCFYSLEGLHMKIVNGDEKIRTFLSTT